MSYTGWASPTDSPYSADPTGATDSRTAFVNCISGNADIVVMPGTYLLSNVVAIPATGDGKTLYFMPGVTLVSSQPPTAAAGMFSFAGTGANFRIVGNGVQLKYATAPTTRTNHVLFVTGSQITDLEIDGIVVQNGANMGIAVFCGPGSGGTATGSANIHIHDCKIRNTLGDGVHVENADSGVRIHDIQADGTRDDVVAVINYTGPGGASIHPTATQDVQISRILARNVHTATVSLAGVQDFVVDDINEVVSPGEAVFTVKMTHAQGYDVANQGGTIDNVVSTGATKVLVFDTPGALTQGQGTSGNKDIRVGKVVAHGVVNQAFSLSNAGTAAGAALSNIEIESLDLHGNAAGSQVGYISNAKDVRIERLTATGFGAGLLGANSVNLSWGSMKLGGFAPSTSFALSFNGDTNIRPGSLLVDAGNCATGLQFQSNAGVVHEGAWVVSNAVTNFLFGACSAVRGWFDVVGESRSVGSVTAGTLVVTYPRAVPAGAAILPTVTTASDTPFAWSVKAVGNANMTMVWGAAGANVRVNYQIAMQAA